MEGILLQRSIDAEERLKRTQQQQLRQQQRLQRKGQARVEEQRSPPLTYTTTLVETLRSIASLIAAEEEKVAVLEENNRDKERNETKERYNNDNNTITDNNKNDNNLPPDQWLYHLISSYLVSSSSTVDTDGPLSLSLAVLSVCRQHGSDEPTLQDALFGVLGMDAFDVLTEVFQRAVDLGKNVTEEMLREVHRSIMGEDEGDGGLGLGVSSKNIRRRREEEKKEEEENTRLMLLRERAYEAANLAAIAKANHDNVFPSTSTAKGQSTHTIMRKSEEKELKREMKRLSKIAAEAHKDAIDAGAIVEGIDGAGNENGYDERMAEESRNFKSSKGLDALHDMNLHAEGTLQYRAPVGLPSGTERIYCEGYEKVIVPPPVVDKAKLVQRLLLDDVLSHSKVERSAFKGTDSLNHLQSAVFDIAYGSSQNMLVCAPTGAGKTNVAMLTIVRHLTRVGALRDRKNPNYDRNNHKDVVCAAGSKAIYVAPMRALASEVVDKFSERLRPLGIIVREYTGDSTLTKQEAESAHVLVVTPEKWDVVTRRDGSTTSDGTLGSSCGLLILDEVHLLADERGSVIESVVARLHRRVESTQRMVRVVGLSATLPNPECVATFLRVDLDKGLFKFGQEYRPVPLRQSFIGIISESSGGGGGRWKQEQKLNGICYDVVADVLRRGHQIMVFVHSRKGTGDTARALVEIAKDRGEENKYFSPFVAEGDTNTSNEKWVQARSNYADRALKSKNSEVRDLFNSGCGIHHAGMLRADRKLTEKMFTDGAIRLLCCTSTLAWGVNLPARAVVIKGTDIFDPERGGLVDISILDVMQIFGRAGRPQFDDKGEATLITSHKALGRYLDKLVREVPIESSFIKRLPDHLNAEVAGGTVTNISEAAEWLSYTYLHVRMKRNPVTYGVSIDAAESDPGLVNRSKELITEAAKELDDKRMVRFDTLSGNLSITDLGRVASSFYVRGDSVSTFNTVLDREPNMIDGGDLCHLVCQAEEFENVKVRKDETEEIDSLKDDEDACPLGLRKATVEQTSGKCSILFQAYISRKRIKTFSLVSDTNYVSNSAGRVARALFEMCLKRGLAGAALGLLRLANAVDKRVWWFQTPLRQFEGELRDDSLRSLESIAHRGRSSTTDVDMFSAVLSLLDMGADEVGEICRWRRGGGEKILRLVRKIPYIEIQCSVHPITRSVLRFKIEIVPIFEWDGRWHGPTLSFWLWIEDGTNQRIYHHEHITLKKRNHPDPLSLSVFIPAFEPLPPQYFVRVVSDSWVGSEATTAVSFKHLLLPELTMPYTNLIDLTPLPTSALNDPVYESLYDKIDTKTFNPIQTQLFHMLYHTDLPVLVGAPTGSGKTIIAEIALLRMKKKNPTAKAVYIAPLKSLARERLKEWKAKFNSSPLRWKVLELSGDTHHDRRALNSADVLVCTPEKWDLISRGWQGSAGDGKVEGRKFVKEIGLLIIDEIHLLGEERGAVLEAIVSRTRFISQSLKEEKNKKAGSSNDSKQGSQCEATRIVGLSTAIANPDDLADWMGINASRSGSGKGLRRGMYNFRPSVRPVPMEVHISGFEGRHYCPRMATMNKPCYAAIKEHSPTKPVIIFVASRRQTRLTAIDLIGYAASDQNPRAFLGCDEASAESIASTVKDSALRHTLEFGIGLHHAGLSSRDREIVEQMFLNGSARVLVATATLAWGVNLPAHLVIVKGTEYFDGKEGRYVDYPVTDVLQMMGRAGRPQFDTKGVACVMVAEGMKNFYKRFLYEPFPIESCLLPRLADCINAEIVSRTVRSTVDCEGYIEWTYFARRVRRNPSYYGVSTGGKDDIADFFRRKVQECLIMLWDHGCVTFSGRGNNNGEFFEGCEVVPTPLGIVSCTFYLNHKTPMEMRTGLRGVQKILCNILKSKEEKNIVETPYFYQNSKTGMKIKSFSYTSNVAIPTMACLFYALSHNCEFNELPVRHNEDQMNSDLSERLPWGVDCRSVLDSIEPHLGIDFQSTGDDDEIMADPYTKCFLLIQAFITGEELPISDYITDTYTVIDQLPRLIAAMRYLVEQDSRNNCIFDLICIFSIIRQVLKTKAMLNSDPLHQLPGISTDEIKKLKTSKKSLYQLRSMSQTDLFKTLKDIFNMERRDTVVKYLQSIPYVTVNDASVRFAGKNIGILQLKLTFNGGENRKQRQDTKFSYNVIIGTWSNHLLLSSNSVMFMSGKQKSIDRRNIEMKFDWPLAKSDCEGGYDAIILRILSEDIQGMDIEVKVPLIIG